MERGVLKLLRERRDVIGPEAHHDYYKPAKVKRPKLQGAKPLRRKRST